MYFVLLDQLTTQLPSLIPAHTDLCKQSAWFAIKATFRRSKFIMSSEPDRYFCDKWPTLPDGQPYDGRELLALVWNGKNPFENAGMSLVIKEIEDALGSTVVDIPIVTKGSNNLVSRSCAVRS